MCKIGVLLVVVALLEFTWAGTQSKCSIDYNKILTTR